jgi:SulP family sulfate permease
LERVDEQWPGLEHTRHAVVVLELRTLPDVPSSTLVKAFARWTDRRKARDGLLILAGVEPGLRTALDHSGLSPKIGPDNVIPASSVVLAAVEQARERGQSWLAGDVHGRTR